MLDAAEMHTHIDSSTPCHFLFIRRLAGTLVGHREKSVMNPRCLLALGALPLIAVFPATAADNSQNESIVVTATRQATRANELMSDVSVISREEIEAAGQSTLEQVLARQPGIQYQANGGPGASSGVFIRGASPKQSIVLIDGQRTSSATSGDTALSRIPLSQIDRIEILRGPASSLYGADAIGGVIQIFTKRGEGPVQFTASTGFGTDRTSDSSVGVSGNSDVISYSLRAGYYETKGFNARNTSTTGVDKDDDGYRNSNYTANFSMRPAQGHEIGVNFFSSSGKSDYDGKADMVSDQGVSSYSMYSRNKLHSLWTSTIRLGRSTDATKNYKNSTRTTEFRTDQDQISWQNDIKLPIGTALLAAEYLNQKVDSTTAYSEDERSVRSLLAGWTGSLDNHRFQINLRRDDNSQFGGKTTGAATYGYQLTSAWRGHISYGTAFRAPTFNELYFPLSNAANYQGNPDLQPEVAHNREAGVTWERGAHHFSAIYFNNKVTDLISTTGIPLQNVARATLEGTSLNYTGQWDNWNGGISIDLGQSRDDVTGKRLIRRADEQIKSHLGYTLGAWTVGGEWQVTGHRFDNAANTERLGGYALVNLFADYRLQKDWSVFARANNIFDKYYELADTYNTPGANLFVGLRYSQK